MRKWYWGIILVGITSQAWGQPVLKTYVVPPAWLDGANLSPLARKVYESFIIGLHQGNDPAHAPADPLYSYAAQARTFTAAARMPRNPFHPGDKVYVRLEGTLPSLPPGRTAINWRFKYYPPYHPAPGEAIYGVTYEPEDPKRQALVELLYPDYGDKAFPPDFDPQAPIPDPAGSAEPVPGIQFYVLPGGANPSLPADGEFPIQPGEFGIGTIELQYEYEYLDTTVFPPVTRRRWASIRKAEGGPVVVRFVVSPVHVRPQYANSDPSLDDTPNASVAGEGNPFYPQVFNALGRTAPNELALLRELVRPVFLIGYLRDGNTPPPPPYPGGSPYYFPVSPGAKAQDKDFVVQNKSDEDLPSNSLLRFEVLETPRTVYQGEPLAQTYFPGLTSVLMPFEAWQFFAPGTLPKQGSATGTITVHVPRFQPPSADAFRRESQTPAQPTDRYRGLVRLFVDEAVGGSRNGRWDVLLIQWRDQNNQIYEQFDRVECEDPLLSNPELVPNTEVRVEHYETFGMEVSVPIERSLLVREETVDVGKAVHGQATVDVATARAAGRKMGRLVVENRGNVPLRNLKIWPAHLHRTEASTQTSLPRQMQSLPITSNTLRTDIPSPWRIPVAPMGSLSGLADERYVQVGWENVSTYPVPTKRIALGQPIGHYAGVFKVYEDLDDDGVLDSGEPFDDVVIKVRVVESPLMKVLGGGSLFWFNAFDAGEGYPAALLDPQSGALWVVWASNRQDLSSPSGTGLSGSNPNAGTPWNLFSVAASVLTGGGWPGPFLDPNYRTWDWTTSTFAALTNDTQAYTFNRYPSVARDGSGNYWLIWHQEGLSPEGLSVSRLIYRRGGPGNWAQVVLPDSRLRKQAPRAFVQNLGSPNLNVLWLFWHNAAGGQARLFFNALRDNNGVVTDFFTGQARVQDYPLVVPTALAYTKDAAPLPEFANNQLVRIHLFYTGWAPLWRNEDIYWSRYDPNRIVNPNPTVNNNIVVALPYGRLPFPRLMDRARPVTIAGQPNRSPGEQLEVNPTRDTFASRHPDWYVTPALSPPFTPQPQPGFPQRIVSSNAAAPDLVDPVIYVRRKATDVDPNTGNPIAYPVQWDPNDRVNNSFDRKRGEAVVLVTGPDFLVWKDLNGDGIISQAERVPANRTGLRMRINPARGTVHFSLPLYGFEDMNGDFRFTPGVDVNLNQSAAVSPEVVEVFADYTPLAYRITTDPASDAQPSVAADQFGRLFIVWRRSDEEGKSRLWYTVYSTAIQLNFPPVAQITSITPLDGAFQAQPIPVLGPNNAGLIYFTDYDVGKRVRVQYVGYPDPSGKTTFDEVHRIPGFAPERMLPLDTVSSETHAFALAEDFRVYYDATNLNLFIPASRFWLFWTASREVEDPATNLPHRSSDLYFATVAPLFSVGSEGSVAVP